MHINEQRYYIAKLGVCSDELMQQSANQMNVFGASLNAVEVFDTPFDAVRALNKVSKLMPEHHVTIYCTPDNGYTTLTIANNSEYKTLITADIVSFIKYDTMALGGLVYSL